MKKAKQALMVVSDESMEKLRQEITAAVQEWENANRYFQYALGADQVDYAIYLIISAEKRYEMLIRKAKQVNNNWPSWRGVIE